MQKCKLPVKVRSKSTGGRFLALNYLQSCQVFEFLRLKWLALFQFSDFLAHKFCVIPAEKSVCISTYGNLLLNVAVYCPGGRRGWIQHAGSLFLPGGR